MKIQARLSIVFVTLLIFGVTAVSSYSILFIRNYLLKSGTERLARDARTYAIAFQETDSPQNEELVEQYKANSEYGLIISNSDDLQVKLDEWKSKQQTISILQHQFNIQIYHDKQAAILYAVSKLDHDNYLIVTQSEEKLFEPVKTIRWIIYSGMFISIVLILIVSTLTARSLSKPIKDLTEYADEIANGKEVNLVFMNRTDEIGVLSKALNTMASTLKQDNAQLQDMYDRHRQFYADITHEVRNPLHTIGGSLEMLQLEQVTTEQKQQFVDNAQAQLERINRMFNDLLTLQKFDSNEYRLHLTSFDLTDLLKRVKQSFDSRATKQGLEILIPNKPFWVRADRDKIEQVFDNLMSNALKYSQAKFVKIGAVEKGESVQISIDDNGIGISEEHIQHLFVRFYRADTSRSREKGGTGLGLAVVKSIIDAHGSTIKFSSKPNEGTHFNFDLRKSQVDG